MSADMEFMDIDGPEFLLSVNNEIDTIRKNIGTNVDSTDIFDSRVGNGMALEEYNELCILDTNFLISKLGYLDTVLTLAEENPGSLLVLLPWVVIRELDGLKNSNYGTAETEIGVRARKAMRFIELRLREKSISLRGQKMNEILNQSMTQKQNVKGDDRILDCCMYFQHMTGKKVTLLSNDRNLCIKVMVHDIESISAESVPKMEALLNRIGGKQSKIPTKKWTVIQPEQNINTDDYVMEIDEFYPNHHHSMEEDYDMMIDEEETTNVTKPLKGTSESRWAKYKEHTKPSLAYLDNDPTLVAPKKPPQNLTYSNSNYVPITKDSSWTSIYSPR